jgi:hypothetical protein
MGEQERPAPPPLQQSAHLTPLSHPSADNNSAVAAVADYHVVLWTSVALAVILLGVLYAMLAMGDAPLDSQLRAQVVDKRASTTSKNK